MDGVVAGEMVVLLVEGGFDLTVVSTCMST